MKHRMHITQECWEYDLTTNSIKFMQQTTSSSEVTAVLVLQSTYLINNPKVKANVENVHV